MLSYKLPYKMSLYSEDLSVSHTLSMMVFSMIMDCVMICSFILDIYMVSNILCQ